MTQATFLNRQAPHLRPDPSRVIMLPFKPSTEPRNLNPTDKTRANGIVRRVLSLGPIAAERLLADVLENFEGRHRNLLATFEARADEMAEALATHDLFTDVQRQLVGAYFMHEYSFEAAALFNPSIVAHPDQTGAPEGGLRFILSLRAVGEGHVSSLTFRTGCIGADGCVAIDPSTGLASLPRLVSRVPAAGGEVVDVAFPANEDISERVIFPVTRAQSNGIEDARFLRFEDGTFCATYTAYSGLAIRSEMIETRDFLTFRLSPMQGDAAQNKGMAMFPRKIDGRFAMIGRQDNENLYLIYSDDRLTWNGGREILRPQFPWEFVQIGNCGPPIELDEGWLLLTHGVGAVRRYAVGAALLDKHDPSKVLARCPEPLIRPDPSEREGYVPNVVYTCGAIRHRDQVILPYALSDTFSNFATIEIAALLQSMERC